MHKKIRNSLINALYICFIFFTAALLIKTFFNINFNRFLLSSFFYSFFIFPYYIKTFWIIGIILLFVVASIIAVYQNQTAKINFIIIFALFLSLFPYSYYYSFQKILNIFYKRSEAIDFLRFFSMFLFFQIILDFIILFIKKIFKISSFFLSTKKIILSFIFTLLIFTLFKNNIYLSIIVLFFIFYLIEYFFKPAIFYNLLRKKSIFILSIIFISYLIFLNFIPINNKNKPNIILITIDALRPDFLSIYNPEQVKVNSLENFIKNNKAYKFNFTVSAAPNTIPSFPRVFCTEPKIDYAYENNVYVPELLGNTGYERIAFVHNPLIEMGIGALQKSFDFFWSYSGYKSILYNDALLQLNLYKRYAENLYTKVVKYLTNRRTNSPLFLWVHFFDPHSPYSPPGKYKPKTKFDGNMYKIGLMGYIKKLPEKKFKKEILLLYKSEIKYTDIYLDKLLNFLKEKKYFENSIIIITADHGESFGENNIYSHGFSLQQAEEHIPLLIYFPPIIKNIYINNYLNNAFVSYNLFPLINKVLLENNISIFNNKLKIKKHNFVFWNKEIAIFEKQNKAVLNIETNKIKLYKQCFNLNYPVKETKDKTEFTLLIKKLLNLKHRYSNNSNLIKNLKNLGYIN